MNFFKYLLILFLFTSLSILHLSYSKIKDIRDNIVGAYNYYGKAFFIKDSLITPIPDGETKGIMIVKKNESNYSTIDFFQNGKLIFQATKIKEVNNILIFDIFNQEINDKEDEDVKIYYIEAYNYWDLEGRKYSGFYDIIEKKIKISMEITGRINPQKILAFGNFLWRKFFLQKRQNF
ncbi:MAG: hypothetical protein B6I24_03215 [Bacteroidetes bacterium 4572_128]|nr:MAG: hypothetical protein B6I24_03215 [Bacteroidetes bacterium 4572_128]